jgi:hypothetical protein
MTKTAYAPILCRCGGKPEVGSRIETPNGNTEFPFVRCPKCGREVAYGILAQTCIEEWNNNQGRKDEQN